MMPGLTLGTAHADVAVVTRTAKVTARSKTEDV